AVEPSHFVVDQRYIERKGPVDDVQVWAVGQAVNLVKRMDALLEPKRAPAGTFPELVLFDCQSCHHPYNTLGGGAPGATGLPPGSVKLEDANAVMLRIIAARLAPTAAKAVGPPMLALRRTTTENWAAVKPQANDLRRL